jgi:3-deoxy-D-manno-octulosonic-acid transferase
VGSFSESVYRSAATAAWVLSPLFDVGDSKVARTVRARFAAGQRLIEWAREHRALARPLLWMHASSVGEGLQARAALEALVARRPDLQVVFTHFSPSAEALAARMPADYAGPLPWDAPSEIEPVMKAVQPGAVVFTKNDLWPVLAAAARARGARTALVAASLHDGSSRGRWPMSGLLRSTLAALELCAAISDDDAKRLAGAGVPSQVLDVTGDPGVDSAAARAAAAAPAAPHLRPFHEDRRPTLVAGSTWLADHEALLLALSSGRPRFPRLRVVIAPHEPNEGEVRRLEASFGGTHWRTTRLSQVESTRALDDTDVVIVDRVGVLAELYTIGDVAWVGGGFHRAGLHSVLEPAAAGLPILFGPIHGSSRAAADLLALGAARVAKHPNDTVEALSLWLDDDAARRSAGEAGRRYIAAHLGASERTAELISRLIPSTSAR